MQPLDLWHLGAAFGAAIIAGMINSVAGGGTLVSFPVLIWLGLPPVTANATSTVSIWPGSLGGMWGYRSELRGAEPRIFALVAPSLLGGIAGALLLRWTPPAIFADLVPYLILAATLLFMAQEPIQRRVNTANAATHRSWRWLGGAILFQFAVAVYGGYFGAGIGILMLASLGVLGLRDIHMMNALKTILSTLINGMALIYFTIKGLIVWPIALLMAAGAILGGYAGARVAKQVNQNYLQIFIVAVGLFVSAWLFFR